jgi:hypothetical protein
MDRGTTLEELRNEVRCMDEPELLAFRRQHRANPDSVEYLEAKAEWESRQQKKAEVPKPSLLDRHPRNSRRWPGPQATATRGFGIQSGKA